ncbi:MAG: hypothetical protein DRO40_07580, partial [Thermoprotei archaeon]
MLYVSVEQGLLNKIRRNYILLWFPGALFNISECKPNDWFFTDCCIHKFLQNKEVARLLLTLKLPRKLHFTGSPVINAPILKHYRCRLIDFYKDIDTVIDYIRNPSLLETSSEQMKTSFLQFMPPAGVFISSRERIVERWKVRIQLSLLKEILTTICMYESKPKLIKWIESYLLMGINVKKKEVVFFVGNKKVKAPAHKRYIFEYKEIF